MGRPNINCKRPTDIENESFMFPIHKLSSYNAQGLCIIAETSSLISKNKNKKISLNLVINSGAFQGWMKINFKDG